MARIAVIAGDGIGPEVIREAVKVGQAAAQAHEIDLSFEPVKLDADTFLDSGIALPAEVFEHLRDDFDAILFGALGDPRVPDSEHLRGILLGLRRRLDLFANVRPVKLLAEDLSPLRRRECADVRLVVVRENTEGAYVDAGYSLRAGTSAEIGVEQDVNTHAAVERILVHALELGRTAPRRRVCMADKSNVLVHGHGLWKRLFEELRHGFPEVEARHLYIDALAMELVRDPAQFDVIVTCNLFGDIITDLGAQLQGGMGVAASANINPVTGAGLFEPVHGSAPDIVGRGTANPVAAILSLQLLLEHLGHGAAAAAVEAAVVSAMRSGTRTPDIGGTAGTVQVGDAIAMAVTRSTAAGVRTR